MHWKKPTAADVNISELSLELLETDGSLSTNIFRSGPCMFGNS